MPQRFTNCSHTFRSPLKKVTQPWQTGTMSALLRINLIIKQLCSLLILAFSVAAGITQEEIAVRDAVWHRCGKKSLDCGLSIE